MTAEGMKAVGCGNKRRNQSPTNHQPKVVRRSVRIETLLEAAEGKPCGKHSLAWAKTNLETPKENIEEYRGDGFARESEGLGRAIIRRLSWTLVMGARRKYQGKLQSLCPSRRVKDKAP